MQINAEQNELKSKPDKAPGLKVRSLPFFNYPALFKLDEKMYVDTFRAVCERGAYILQSDLLNFEDKLAKYVGVKHALGVGNCTDGLYLIIRAAGIPRGAEVIISSHTFIATASAIVQAGGVPVPVECGSDHLLDATSFERAITPNTWAVIPTQLNGRVAEMDSILKVANAHKLFVFEDAAQALGAKYKSQNAGSFGVASAFSFYPAKSLGCLGDGGAVVTNDTKLFEKMQLMRNHGRGDGTEVLLWGINSRLDNLQAAFLNFLLDQFPGAILRRREMATLYDSLLSDLAELVLPISPTKGEDHFDSFQNYEIEADRMEDLQVFLKSCGIGTLRQWGGKAV
ncbi:MAG: cell wall biogenesis protein, partial [Deltaproteobacteria bacterium CG11_big_fil_rev_8_21_14_0_20_45_16]